MSTTMSTQRALWTQSGCWVAPDRYSIPQGWLRTSGQVWAECCRTHILCLLSSPVVSNTETVLYCLLLHACLYDCESTLQCHTMYQNDTAMWTRNRFVDLSAICIYLACRLGEFCGVDRPMLYYCAWKIKFAPNLAKTKKFQNGYSTANAKLSQMNVSESKSEYFVVLQYTLDYINTDIHLKT